MATAPDEIETTRLRGERLAIRHWDAWRRMVVDATGEIELGYSVVPELWGRGLATEMGEAAVRVAFGSFGYPSVVAFTLASNAPSERVMQKLGFAREKNFVHAGEPHVLYRRRNP